MHRKINSSRSWHPVAIISSIISSIIASIPLLFTQSCYAQSADTTEGNVKALRDSLFFHAPFDTNGDARTSRSDGRLYTTESLARKEWTIGIQRDDVSIAKGAGVFGDCIRFTDKNPKVLCYRGEVLPYGKGPWAGTVCFWMRLDADKDLKPGYCDPIQITQKAWNDAALFVDFDKDIPRDFRLGVFSNLTDWNPQNVPWEKWPVEKRPMVTVKNPSFSREAWKHVAFSFENINATNDRPSKAALYLDGKIQGTIVDPMKFSWELDKTAIMIGIEYIGDLDELMLFDRSLDEKDLQMVIQGKVSK